MYLNSGLMDHKASFVADRWRMMFMKSHYEKWHCVSQLHFSNNGFRQTILNSELHQ
ncbi:hypothetical protein OAU93_00435 [bacterium]|nr:hypothetical protein [bacterium]